MSNLTLCKIVPKGRIDIHNHGQYLTEIKTAITTAVKEVIIDLGHVTFLDSACLGLLVRGYKLCKDHGIGFRITGVVNEGVALLFELTKLSMLLPVEKSYQPAPAHRGIVPPLEPDSKIFRREFGGEKLPASLL
ncbi:MAG: STAS domain-containing protein [Pseudanabaenaceae cyanobacterium]